MSDTQMPRILKFKSENCLFPSLLHNWSDLAAAARASIASASKEKVLAAVQWWRVDTFPSFLSCFFVSYFVNFVVRPSPLPYFLKSLVGWVFFPPSLLNRIVRIELYYTWFFVCLFFVLYFFAIRCFRFWNNQKFFFFPSSKKVRPTVQIRTFHVVLVVKNPPENAGDIRDPGSISGWEDPWRKEWQPTPVFLPGESNGQRSPAGYSGSHRVRHNWKDFACTIQIACFFLNTYRLLTRWYISSKHFNVCFLQIRVSSYWPQHN